MSCPYFKEGHFGICVAPDAIHVPSIAEVETFCFRVFYESCPNFALSQMCRGPEMASTALTNSVFWCTREERGNQT